MTADTASPANGKDAAQAHDHLMRVMREKFKDLFKDTKNPLFTLTGAPELVSEYLGFAGIAAGTMDYLGMDAALDRTLPPEDAPGSIPGSALLRALVTELLSAAPAPDLREPREYFAKMPLEAFLNRDIPASALTKDAISRFLDRVQAYGPERIFTALSGAAFKNAGLTITSCRLGSAEFALWEDPITGSGQALMAIREGKRSKSSENGDLTLLSLTDARTRIPLFALSGTAADFQPEKLPEFLRLGLPLLKEQFPDLRYLALEHRVFTPEILAAAQESGVSILMKLPNTLKCVKSLREADFADGFVSIAGLGRKTCRARFCGNTEISGIKVQLILAETEEDAEKTPKVSRFVIAAAGAADHAALEEILAPFAESPASRDMWRISRDPRIFAGSLLLSNPDRRNALLMILATGMLVADFTEYVMKNAMERENLKMPAPDHRVNLASPGIARFKELTDNSRICMLFFFNTGNFMLPEVPDIFASIVVAMGECWLRYYQAKTYADFYSGLAAGEKTAKQEAG
ncbi:DUF4277 domain-containing protein [Succinimonas sp.]|uniref:DUF4277 domain-containing protein n=1 Tax=Succinimonas sp. TaxID=1936151 RepID=UPI0038642993